jgi:hypothetical protein
MAWVEIFAVFFVCHLVGDYLLQTDWQARNKPGGLGRDPLARRALVSHIASYTLAFVPALVWIGDEVGAAEAVGIGAIVAVPHLIQDDGRLLKAYIARVKGDSALTERSVATAADQSFHILALFLTALLAAS